MAVTHRVGGEVDAFCTRCKLTLAHTILAMLGPKVVRVRCNTCNGDHAYRAEPGAKASAKPRAPRKPSADRPSRQVLSYHSQMNGRDATRAPDYSARETYAPESLIRHPTFGVGIVSIVRGDKIEAMFESGVKTLVHGRGGAPVEKPAYRPPPVASLSPADKPQPEADEAEG